MKLLEKMNIERETFNKNNNKSSILYFEKS
jgi:hypothetical protein